MVCDLGNKVHVSEADRYIIKLTQILAIDIFIDDGKEKVKLINVVKMRSTFLIEYEERLIKEAVEEAVEEAESRAELNILHDLFEHGDFTAADLANRFGYTEDQIITGKLN